ncbi:protein tem1 [Anaeramoeba flamelloides]|uniref:Protein tem1 n=1 Tax=Anaeramoeba flamelloides TaxID=1746091 RepID=A0AAV8A6S1_9EUKA|nr:protein tem1 [Anaeramoeba flamelloides]
MLKSKKHTKTKNKKIVQINKKKKPKILIKVGLLGDAFVGKTTLMAKYARNKFDQDYIQSLGGHYEFVNMLPLVCNEAQAILYMFDLTRRSTLRSVKSWYRQSKGLNNNSISILVGTKYDLFCKLPYDEQKEIVNVSRRYAMKMNAPLIFCSSKYKINISIIFKIIISKLVEVPVKIKPISKFTEPIREGY